MPPWKLYRPKGLEEWESLWRRAVERTPGSFFQRFEPSLHWARIFAADGRLRLWLNDRETAIAAFTVHQGKLALLGQGLFDYLDLVGDATPHMQRQLVCDVLAWDEWESLEITGVPADSRFSSFWGALQPERQEFSASPLLLDAEDFHQRHRRLAQRFQQQLQSGWELGKVDERHERRSLLQWILDQKEQGIRASGRSNVLDHDAVRWLQAMVECEPALTELWQLRKAGETAAGLLTWHSAPTRYAYTISYSRKAAAMSPGVLLLYGVLRHNQTEGKQFDFLTGEQPFKLRFADARRHLLRIRKQRPHEIPAKERITRHESGTEGRVR